MNKIKISLSKTVMHFCSNQSFLHSHDYSLEVIPESGIARERIFKSLQSMALNGLSERFFYFTFPPQVYKMHALYYIFKVEVWDLYV